MQRAFSSVTARLPNGWGDLGKQIALVVMVDTAYSLVRGMADGQRAVAFAHGQQIIHAERATGTLFEPGFQSLFLQFQWLIDFANQVYMNSQFAVIVGFFLWIYFFHNEAYYFVRNMFIVSMGLALVGYAAYATAPPRLFPEHGFVDTLNEFSAVNHDSGMTKAFINPYAAVPSMHCAFALMVGMTGARLARWRPVKLCWAGWPPLVAWVVIVTGNHYWIDVALGWGVALASALVAGQLLARARPHAWAWRREPLPEID
jgi:membrane-associated phospholipid phosphatase